LGEVGIAGEQGKENTTVDLYLIRHAEAEPRDDAGTTPDEERVLTSAGQAEARAVAAGLLRRGVRLDAVVTSPLVRARQTAEALLAGWPPPAPALHVSGELAPGGKRRKLVRFLGGLSAHAVGLVGHMPDLGELGGWLLGSRKVELDLAKAGVALIHCNGDVGKGEGSLVWMVPPDWLTAGGG
jgi:phosphohistidine phosphatase